RKRLRLFRAQGGPPPAADAPRDPSLRAPATSGGVSGPRRLSRSPLSGVDPRGAPLEESGQDPFAGSGRILWTTIGQTDPRPRGTLEPALGGGVGEEDHGLNPREGDLLRRRLRPKEGSQRLGLPV